MKEEDIRRYKLIVSMFVIIGMVMAGTIPLGVLGVGSLPDYDIEQDSLGNYHKAYIDNSTGNYEVYYTNDIGGHYPQDWNPPTRITNTTNESMLLDLGIYLETDTLFIIWQETDRYYNCTVMGYPTFYTISRDYGSNWTEPWRSGQKILLKYQDFDPLIEEPDVPPLPFNWWSPYAYYIVQLKTPMIQEWWDGIEAVGGVFCGYIPNNGYILCMSPRVKDQVEQIPYIRWIGAYHPLYKINDELNHIIGTIEIRVLVFEEINGQENINKTIQEIIELGGNITDINRTSYIIRTEIDALKIENISYIPEVEWIEKHNLKVIEMNNVRTATGANYVADPLNGGYDGCKDGINHIIGAISDDGIDKTHTEFADRLIAIYDDPPPVSDHGTSCFGIIFAEGKDTQAKGMLPEGHGIFMDWNNYYRGSAMMMLYKENGLFLSNSWSEEDYEGQYLSDTSEQNDRAVNAYPGLMLYSSGDGGYKVSSDAAAKNIIAVGGMDQGADETILTDDVFWPGSCYRTADGRQKPDLVGPAAPVNSIYTTKVGGYWGFQYTSAACPVVSGAAGLVYEMYRHNHFGNNPTNVYPKEFTVKALLIANAYQYDFGTQATREQQGWGAVDLKRIHEVGDQHLIIDGDINLKTGDTNVHNFYVTNAPDMKISLVWRDEHGNPASGKALVNNLDLKVTSPTNDVYWGNNGLESSHWSTPGNNENFWSNLIPKNHIDDKNNVENVFIQNPTTGNWKIEVIGSEISMDQNPYTTEIDQHFALIVSCKDNYKELTLYPGWNLISLPLIQSQTYDQTPYNYKNSEQIDIVLRSISGYYDKVEYFDATDAGDPWKSYTVGKPFGNDLQVLGHRMGFWINIVVITYPVTLPFRVYGWEFTSNQEIQLDTTAGGGGTGWNMVGYPSTVSNLVPIGLNNLDFGPDKDIDVIQYFDAQTDTWYFMDVSDTFELGVGYWFHYRDEFKGSPYNWIVPYT